MAEEKYGSLKMETVSTRLLIPGDEKRVEAFLEPHTPFTFDIRSDIKKGGLLYEGKPDQAEYFGVFNSGNLVGVLSHNWAGVVQSFAVEPRFIQPLADEFRNYRTEHPREIGRFVGATDQTEPLCSSLGLQPSAFREDLGEGWLFSLPLEKVIVPPLLEKPGIKARRATEDDIPQLARWRHDADAEVNWPSTPEDARKEVVERVGKGELFVLEDNARLVSFCGVDGALSDWKHFSSFYTPPEARKKGYGSATLAGALLTLRQEGFRGAVLSTANPSAASVNRAVGFEDNGNKSFCILKEPVVTLSNNPHAPDSYPQPVRPTAEAWNPARGTTASTPK